MKNKIKALPKAALKLFQEWGRQGGIIRSKKIGPKRCAEIAQLARDTKKQKKKKADARPAKVG